MMTIPLAVTIAGVLFMALYAGLETGIYTLNRVRLAVRIAQGDKRAIALQQEVQRSTRSLIVLLCAINIAGYAQAWGVATILHEMGFDTRTTALIDFAIILPLSFLVCDLVPKDLFRLFSDRWTYPLVPALVWARRVLVWTGVEPMLEGVAVLAARLVGVKGSTTVLSSREQVSHWLREGEGAGLLRESDIVVAEQTLRASARTALDAMIPWSDVQVIGVDLEGEARVAFLRESEFTRLPVVNTENHVVGMLACLDAWLDPQRTSESLMLAALFVEPTESAPTVLRKMRDQRTQMAFVGTAESPLGLLSLKDLARPIVGDFPGWSASLYSSTPRAGSSVGRAHP